MANSNIYAVGFNGTGQFGMGHRNAIGKLTSLINKININAIHCGCDFIIYTTDKGECYSAGNNRSGACALDKNVKKDWNISTCQMIEYFNQINVKIQKTFVNVNSDSVFWQT
eukprot:327376_1